MKRYFLFRVSASLGVQGWIYLPFLFLKHFFWGGLDFNVSKREKVKYLRPGSFGWECKVVPIFQVRRRLVPRISRWPLSVWTFARCVQHRASVWLRVVIASTPRVAASHSRLAFLRNVSDYFPIGRCARQIMTIPAFVFFTYRAARIDWDRCPCHIQNASARGTHRFRRSPR